MNREKLGEDHPPDSSPLATPFGNKLLARR